MAELADTLGDLVGGYVGGGEVSVAVTDLQTGETVGVALDRPHLSGCTINLFVLLQAARDVEAGRHGNHPVDELIARTLWGSDAVTAHELYMIVGNGDTVAGVERVAELATALGGEAITLDHPPLFPADSRGIDRNNWVATRALNEALRRVYEGAVLEGAELDDFLDAMTVVKPGLNYLVTVGPDAPVSHKNGFFQASDGSWVDNDIGIVRFEQDGTDRAYAISFFSQWVPEKYADVELGQRISASTWQFFQRRYPQPAPAAVAAS